MIVAFLAAALSGCSSSEQRALLSGSPTGALPPHISQLLAAGLRPDWSGDGRRLLFLDDLVGDVFEVDLESRVVRPLTSHFEHSGFSRARYLANDDVLLCGPKVSAISKAERGRWHAELWLLDASLSGPARPLGESCFEGPAVSRKKLRIAWTTEYRQYPDTYADRECRVHVGDIVYENGTPRLVNQRLVLSNVTNPYFK